MAKRRRTFTVTTDGTKAGTSVVDAETGEEIPFAVSAASGSELRPGGRDCLLLMRVSLGTDEAAGEARRATFEVIPGGSST